MPGHEVTEPRLRCVFPFEAEAAEVGLLRKAAAAQLDQWGIREAAGDAELLVTELAANVVKHVGKGASATLVLESQSNRLRIEVHDKSRAVPSPRTANCEEECGRGLHLLVALALEWGTVLTAAGKAVWCEIPLASGSGCRRIERAVGALESYRVASGEAALWCGRRGIGLEESAIKLIADLLHWSTVRGHDPDDILDRAQMHYEADVDAA